MQIRGETLQIFLWPIHTIHSARYSLFAFRSSLFTIHISVCDSESNFVSITTGVRLTGAAEWAGLACRVGFFFFFVNFLAYDSARRRQATPVARRYWNCNCNRDYFTWHPCHAAQWDKQLPLIVTCLLKYSSFVNKEKCRKNICTY